MIKFGKIVIKNTKKNIEETVEMSIKNGKIVFDKDNYGILNDIVEKNDDYEISVEDVYINNKKSSIKNILTNQKMLTNFNCEYEKIVESSLTRINENVSNSNYNSSILEYISHNTNNKNCNELLNNIDSKFGNKKEKSEIKNHDLSNYISIKDCIFPENFASFTVTGRQISEVGFTVKELVLLLVFIGMFIITSVSVYAATTAASNVSYSAPSGSGLSSNVQSAIDELYNSSKNAKMGYNKPTFVINPGYAKKSDCYPAGKISNVSICGYGYSLPYTGSTESPVRLFVSRYKNPLSSSMPSQLDYKMCTRKDSLTKMSTSSNCFQWDCDVLSGSGYYYISFGHDEMVNSLGYGNVESKVWVGYCC